MISIVALIRDTINKIMTRYRKYGELIGYPGDWGERAFRFWLVHEIFHTILNWPIGNIVFGERYDVLLVDNKIRPAVYIETKRPEVSLSKKHVNEAIKRANSFFSIQYVVVTNGIEWLLYDLLKGKLLFRTSVKKANSKELLDFFEKLHAKNYLRV